MTKPEVMEPEHETQFQEVLSFIRELGEGSGITGPGVLEQTISVPEGFFRRVKFRKRLSLGNLMQIIERLGVQPHRVFRHVFGRPLTVEEIVASFALLARRYTADHHQGMDLFDLALHEGKSFSDEQVERLVNIDLHSFSNPQEAEVQARYLYQEVVRQGHLLSAIRAAAVWSSSLRLVERTGASTALILRAVESAKRLPNSSEKHHLFSDLLLRASYLAGESGDHKLAILLGNAAILEGALAGESFAVGKGMVIRSIVARYGDDNELAIASFHSSRLFLEMTEVGKKSNYMLAAWFSQAYGLFFDEEYDEAYTALESIRRHFELEKMPSNFAGRYLWLRALVILRQDGFEAAIPMFSDAFQRLIALFPLDAGVVCVSALLEISEDHEDEERLWLERLLELALQFKEKGQLEQLRARIFLVPWGQAKEKVDEIMDFLRMLLLFKNPKILEKLKLWKQVYRER